jgi:hypothetical protein
LEIDVAGTPANNNDSVWYFWTKDEADKFKHKLNGLSTSVDALKVAAGFAAVGFTPLKIDASAFKMDEKGIVIGGVQKWTWPYARDEKAKLEAQDKKLLRLSERAEAAGRRAKNAADTAQRLLSRTRGNANWATEAERRRAVDVEKDATQALKKATDAYTKVEQLVRKAEAKKEQVETQRATIKRSMDGMGADLERVRTKLDSMASVAA